MKFILLIIIVISNMALGSVSQAVPSPPIIKTHATLEKINKSHIDAAKLVKETKMQDYQSLVNLLLVQIDKARLVQKLDELNINASKEERTKNSKNVEHQFQLARELSVHLISHFPQERLRPKMQYVMAFFDFLRGEYQQGKNRLQTFISKKSSDEKLLQRSNELMGKTELELKNYKESINYFEKNLNGSDHNDLWRGEVIYYNAWAYYQLEKWESAIGQLKELEEYSKKGENLNYKTKVDNDLFLFLAEANRPEDAIAHIKKNNKNFLSRTFELMNQLSQKKRNLSSFGLGVELSKIVVSDFELLKKIYFLQIKNTNALKVEHDHFEILQKIFLEMKNLKLSLPELTIYKEEVIKTAEKFYKLARVKNDVLVFNWAMKYLELNLQLIPEDIQVIQLKKAELLVFHKKYNEAVLTYGQVLTSAKIEKDDLTIDMVLKIMMSLCDQKSLTEKNRDESLFIVLNELINRPGPAIDIAGYMKRLFNLNLKYKKEEAAFKILLEFSTQFSQKDEQDLSLMINDYIFWGEKNGQKYTVIKKVFTVIEEKKLWASEKKLENLVMNLLQTITNIKQSQLNKKKWSKILEDGKFFFNAKITPTEFKILLGKILIRALFETKEYDSFRDQVAATISYVSLDELNLNYTYWDRQLEILALQQDGTTLTASLLEILTKSCTHNEIISYKILHDLLLFSNDPSADLLKYQKCFKDSNILTNVAKTIIKGLIFEQKIDKLQLIQKKFRPLSSDYLLNAYILFDNIQGDIKKAKKFLTRYSLKSDELKKYNSSEKDLVVKMIYSASSLASEIIKDEKSNGKLTNDKRLLLKLIDKKDQSMLKFQEYYSLDSPAARSIFYRLSFSLLAKLEDVISNSPIKLRDKYLQDLIKEKSNLEKKFKADLQNKLLLSSMVLELLADTKQIISIEFVNPSESDALLAEVFDSCRNNNIDAGLLKLKNVYFEKKVIWYNVLAVCHSMAKKYFLRDYYFLKMQQISKEGVIFLNNASVDAFNEDEIFKAIAFLQKAKIKFPKDSRVKENFSLLKKLYQF